MMATRGRLAVLASLMVAMAGCAQSTGTGTPQQQAAVGQELAKAGPPAACHTPASRIAVLGGGIVAELDGCRMVLVGGRVRQGTPALAGLLNGKGR